MVALILYAFATRVRSSRAIECHCRQDLVFRVLTGTWLRIRDDWALHLRHERALAELFSEVLELCAEAGLVEPGVVSIDTTRIAGNASPEVNHWFEQIAREIVAEVRAIDEAEDEEFGEARGDELPERLRTAEGRREFLRQAREQMHRERERPERVAEPEPNVTDEVALELDANEIVGRARRGRDAWLREGKRRLEQHRWEHPDPICRSRGERLLLAAERLKADRDTERRANEAYEHYRATARDQAAGRPGGAASAAGTAGREGQRDRPGLASDRDRLRVRATDAKLARTAGSAPIPASSGKTHRHRLDRGGNRQLNSALHRLAITKGRLDPEIGGLPGRPSAMLALATPYRYYSPAYFRKVAPTLYGGRIRREPELMAEQAHARLVRPPSLHGYAAQLYAMSWWTNFPWLPFIQHPTLVMAGDDDPIIPVLNGRILAKLMPHARLEVITGGGHLFLLEEAERSAALVREFLAQRRA